MTHYQATLKVSYDSPYNKFTTDHPEVTVSQWCSWDRDFVEITSREGVDRRLQDEVSRMARKLHVGIARKSASRDSLGVVFDHCLCDKVSSPPLMEMDGFNCLSLQPYVFRGGSELCRIVALSQPDLTRLISSLERHGEVEVLSKRKVERDFIRDKMTLSIGEVLGGLTPKQRATLLAALEAGYYRKPRGADATMVARSMGIPRTSFIDHVRKAENKVLSSLLPYVSLEVGFSDSKAD